MNDDFEDDYPVDPFAGDQIEACAEGWRKALGLGDIEPVADVLALLRRAGKEDFKLTSGLEIITKSEPADHGLFQEAAVLASVTADMR